MLTTIKGASAALAATAATLGLLLAPVAAAAQSTYLPSYATRSGETIHGTISSFDGAYTMYVRDKRGYVDSVTLHQGTIINPTGIRLQVGYPVTIVGRASGQTLLADEIDTPFQYAPVAYYYPAGPAYPYPYYGPYGAYYGPYATFGFGYRGWGRWR